MSRFGSFSHTSHLPLLLGNIIQNYSPASEREREREIKRASLGRQSSSMNDREGERDDSENNSKANTSMIKFALILE